MLLLIMGPSGTGKTTIGHLLAERIDAQFIEADDFWSQEKRAIMSQGIPLADSDRFGWLESLNKAAKHVIEGGKTAVLACSALRESYRDILFRDIQNRLTIYLHGTYDQIRHRVAERKDHFFPASLVESQFSIVEPPQDALWLDVTQTPEMLVEQIVAELGYQSGTK